MNILYVVKNLGGVEPFGIMQLSAITKGAGHKSFVCILDDENIHEAVRRHKIDVVAMSVLSLQVKSFKTTCTELKRAFPKLPILVGGPHATFFPSIVENWDVDAVVVGEGDRPILPILDLLAAGKSPDDVPNVHTKSKKNPVSRLVEDLDALPFPDRELIHQVDVFAEMPFKSFMATRGCPFNCAYCFNNAFNAMYRGQGRIYRRRSVDNVIAEIKEVRGRYPLDFVRFGDDLFVARYDDWLEEFVRQYSEKIKLPFYFLISPNVVTSQIVKAMKSAGCHSVGMSIESGSESVRQSILNRPISNETMRRAYSILHEHDIKIFSTCMVGLPGTTLEQDLETMRFAMDCKPALVVFAIYTPTPGTQLFDVCKKQNLLPDDFKEEDIPESLLKESCLTCFSAKAKAIQRNIMMLGSFMVWMPWLRGLLMKLIMHCKPNACFETIGVFTRGYLRHNAIFPFKLDWKTFYKLIRKALVVDN